jgi:hypothetical protein
VDDTQRNLVGAAGVTLIPAAIAWATLFPSGSWPVRTLPAVAMVAVGMAFFLVAFHGRTGRVAQWFKRKPKVDPSEERRIDRLGEYLHQAYQEGEKIFQVTSEGDFADEAETWRVTTFLLLREAFGTNMALWFSNPVGTLSGVHVDPRQVHLLRLLSLESTIERYRTPHMIKDTWQPE